MRISDWSSDVCSSDLLPFRGRAAIADPSVARHPAGQARHRQAGLPVVLHRSAQRLDLGIREDGERDRIRALAVAAFWHEEHDEARSEEHTSELQSLMRISYAVFCLKKKK